MSEARAAATLETVTEYGINHIDTAASYGESELRLKPWLEDNRSSVFLATKTGARIGSEARASLELSLERLGVDRVDLIQLHNLVEEDEWHQAFADDGVVAALAAAREEGLCRFIGVTGHGTRIAGMHMRSLEAFEFDSVLFPYNHSMMAGDGYRQDVERLLALCQERGVAVQTIKSIARRRWTDDPSPRYSWYEPIDDADAIGRAVRYVLSNEQIFLNTSSDATLLRLVLDAASGDLSAPTDEEMVADAIALGITPLFDGADLERI